MSNEAMDGGAVREVERLAQQAAGKIVTIEKRDYSTVPLHDPRKPDPEPDTLEFHTLTSLSEYVKSKHDAAYRKDAGPWFLHVKDPTAVMFQGNVHGPFRQRVDLALATAVVPRIRFDDFIDPETFNIMLQANFEDSTQRATVLGLVGGLKAEAVTTVEDDGVSQTATARKGIATVQNVKVPNPVLLRPYRTFAEIAPPESPFILRLKGGGDGRLPHCALFEADGGRWRLTAIERIKAWLKAEVGDACEVYG